MFSVLYIWLNSNNEKDDLIAYVYSNNVLIETIDLNTVEKTYSFTVGSPESDYNIIEVHHGEIGIIDASCPDKICQSTGFINSSLLPIVCLPNKLVIEIKSNDNSGNEPDIITQ